MSRRTARRGVASLALVLTLAIIGAQPAAAADRTAMDRFASFWGAVMNIVPGAHTAANTVSHWFGKSTSEPPVTTDRGFGIDPNGIMLAQPAPAPPVRIQN
jgi:hypothetical protein